MSLVRGRLQLPEKVVTLVERPGAASSNKSVRRHSQPSLAGDVERSSTTRTSLLPWWIAIASPLFFIIAGLLVLILVLIAFIGFFVFGQRLDLPAILGIGLILSGLLIIHLFSNTSPH